MKKTPILYVILIMLTVLALTTIAADSGRQFTTTLTGEAEVNAQGVPNQGDLDGSGTATITLNYVKAQSVGRLTSLASLYRLPRLISMKRP